VKETKPAAAAQPQKAQAAPQQAPSAPSSAGNVVQAKKAPSEIAGSRTEYRVKMSKMRQTIARRLKES
jgi:pyruvate/2-oxoglutarate dehydrogenase complex dihydrolipoamide acyltransferase (E2) component